MNEEFEKETEENSKEKGIKLIINNESALNYVNSQTSVGENKNKNVDLFNISEDVKIGLGNFFIFLNKNPKKANENSITNNLFGDISDIFSQKNIPNQGNLNVIEINKNQQNSNSTNLLGKIYFFIYNKDLLSNDLLQYTNPNCNNENKQTEKIEDLMDLLQTVPIETNKNITQIENNISNNSTSSNQYSLEEKCHEFYRDAEVSFSFTIKKLPDGSYNSIFYMSNHTSFALTNIKINFMVQKFVTLKVLSTSGSTLENSEIKGIKKV